jgi:YD repeat-containing protein
LAQGNLVRRYRLTYDQYAQGPSLLTKVTLVGNDDQSEVTLRTLEYGERSLGWPSEVLPANLPLKLAEADGKSTGVQLMDVNGDGFADVVDNGESIYLGDGQGSFAMSPPWSDELVQAEAAITDDEGIDTGVRFLDANGDGFADIVRSIEDKQAIYLGNGAGWTLDIDFTNSMISQGIFALDADFGSQGLIAIDFNDDGLTDYIRAAAGQAVQAYLNTGSGWSPDPDMTAKLASSGITFVNEDGKGTGATLADIDGNGISHLISAKADAQDRILLGDTFRSGKLVKSVSALGQVIEVAWIPSTTFDNTTSSGIQGLPIALTLVDSMSRSDGRGNTSVMQLEYAGGLFTDKGFRGFRSVIQTPSAGLRTKTQFYQDEARAFQPFEVRAFDSADQLRSLSESETVVTDAEQGVQQVLLSTTETKRFAADGITLTNTSLIEREYDGYMQATSVFTDPQVEVDGDERTAKYMYFQNESLGFWSLIESVTEHDSAGAVMSEAITDYDDARGLPTTIKEWVELGEYVTTSLIYDDFGNVIEVTDRAGGVTSFEYDHTGTFRTQATDALGRIKRSEYDPGFGTLIRDVDASGNATTSSYDAFGGKTRIVAPGDETSPYGTVTYAYSNIGDPQQQSFTFIRTENAGTSDIFETISFFDAVGRVYKTQEEGPDGPAVVTMVEFGEDGQPSASSLPFFEGQAPEMIRSDRDDLGRLIGITDPLGQKLTLSYQGFTIDVLDARGRVIERRRTVDGRTYVTGFAYDSMDRVRQVIYPDGFIANYSYDGGNNLAAVTDKDGKPIADGFQYNASKRITEFRFGTGVTTDYSYDPLARMLSSRTTTGAGLDLQELIYAYDAANNVLSMADLTTGRSQAFEYNAANRLVKAVGPYGEEEYEYDAIGNLLKKGDLHFAHDPLRPQRGTCGVEVGTKKGGGQSNASAIDTCA